MLNPHYTNIDHNCEKTPPPPPKKKELCVIDYFHCRWHHTEHTGTTRLVSQKSPRVLSFNLTVLLVEPLSSQSWNNASEHRHKHTCTHTCSLAHIHARTHTHTHTHTHPHPPTHTHTHPHTHTHTPTHTHTLHPISPLPQPSSPSPYNHTRYLCVPQPEDWCTDTPDHWGWLANDLQWSPAIMN